MWTPFKYCKPWSVILLQSDKSIVWTPFKYCKPWSVIWLQPDKLIVWTPLVTINIVNLDQLFDYN